MIAGIFFSKDLLALMCGDQWTIEHDYKYTQWMQGGNVVIILLFVINAIFRGAGDTITPTKINLVFFWLIQIPLSYFMSIFLALDVPGVFRAIFISETAVGIFTLWLFKKNKWKEVVV